MSFPRYKEVYPPLLRKKGHDYRRDLLCIILFFYIIYGSSLFCVGKGFIISISGTLLALKGRNKSAQGIALGNEVYYYLLALPPPSIPPPLSGGGCFALSRRSLEFRLIKEHLLNQGRWLTTPNFHNILII